MFKNRKVYITLTTATILTTIFIGKGIASISDPGSEGDPIVSKSYVDNTINEKIKEISKILESSNNTSNNNSESNKFNIVELKKGQKLIGKESSEIIVRSGRTTAIGSELGGVSNITLGMDLSTGDDVKNNHLIIVPRDDGRGIYSETDGTFVMIKGGYTIK